MKRINFIPNSVFILILALFIIGFISFSVIFITGKTSSIEKEENSTSIEIDWAAKYPIEEESGEMGNTTEDDSSVPFQAGLSTLLSISQRIQTYGRLVESNSDSFLLKNQIEWIGVKARRLLNHNTRFSQDDLQQLENGQIISIEAEIIPQEDKISNLESFNNWLNNTEETPFLYVQAFVKYDDSGEYPSATNLNRDKLVNRLRAKGIPVLDLRKNAQSEKITVDEAFYKTDHHWKTNLGVWATRIIINEVETNTEIEFDKELLEDNNFQTKCYKNAMFGSYGNTAGKNWSSSENYEIPYPKFNTSFHIEVPNKEVNKNGPFEVLINNEQIIKAMKEGGGYVYETTCFGNTPLTKIHNNNLPNAPKILVIRDSFALATLPYLACVCSEVDSIDIRKSNGNFNGSVKEYVKQFKPDVVIMLAGGQIKEFIQ